MDIKKLNIVMSYPVYWSKYQVMRDFVQNFYDAIGFIKWSDEFKYTFDKSNKILIMEAKQENFSYEWLLHIGASTKTENSDKYAGYFGEGFKIAALCAIRDHNWSVIMESRDWKLEVTTVPDIIDGKTVESLSYKIWKTPNLKGSLLTITNVDESDYAIFLSALDSFYFPQNRLFGKKLWESDFGAVYTRSTHPINEHIPVTYKFGKKGLVLCGYQIRGTNPFPFVFCLHKYNNMDRERNTLYDFEVIDVILRLVTEVSPETAMIILEKMKVNWCSYPARKKNISVDGWSPVINALIRRIRTSDSVVNKFHNSYPYLLCVDRVDSISMRNRRHQALVWAKTEMQEYKMVKNSFSLIGYRFLEDVCDERGGFVDEIRRPDDIENNAFDIMNSIVDTVCKDFFMLDSIPEPLIITNEKVICQGMANVIKIKENKVNKIGQKIRYRHNNIYLLEKEFQSGKFYEALTTYLHELCHMFGGDSSASFSHSLTVVMEIVMKNHILLDIKKKEWDDLFNVGVRQ